MTTVSNGAAVAASKLINTLGGMPQMHSIWISTEVDLKGNFVEVIKVSLHPKTEDKLRPKVPASMDGYEIRLEPWPKALT